MKVASTYLQTYCVLSTGLGESAVITVPFGTTSVGVAPLEVLE